MSEVVEAHRNLPFVSTSKSPFELLILITILLCGRKVFFLLYFEHPHESVNERIILYDCYTPGIVDGLLMAELMKSVIE